MWIDNWQRMLPYVMANQELIPASLLSTIERFVLSPQPLLAIKREHATNRIDELAPWVVADQLRAAV